MKKLTEQQFREIIRKELKKQISEGPMDYLKAIGRLGQKVGGTAVRKTAQKIASGAEKIQQNFAAELSKSQDERFKNDFPADVEKLYGYVNKSITSLIGKYKGAITRATDKESIKLEVQQAIMTAVDSAFLNV